MTHLFSSRTCLRAAWLWRRFGLLPAGCLAAALLLGCPAPAARPDPDRALIDALSRRDEPAAQRALNAGAKANAREAKPAPFDSQGRGHTALYLAMRIPSRSLIDELLRRGADPNERYEASATPLMQAVGLNNLPAAEVLLARGARVDAAAADGSTALHYACLLTSDRMARLLVAHGAPLNVRDRARNTPLGLAKLRNNDVVAKFLKAAGGSE